MKGHATSSIVVATLVGCASAAPAPFVEAPVVGFVPSGERGTFVLGVGADADVSVGDRGLLACDASELVVTEVLARRARAEQAEVRLPVAKTAPIWRRGAVPEPWCPPTPVEPAPDVPARVVEAAVVKVLDDVRPVLVVALGAEAGLRVGDLVALPCAAAPLPVTHVYRAQARLVLPGRPAAAITTVRIGLGGAVPEPWCPAP